MPVRPFLSITVMLLALTSWSACRQQDQTPEAAEEQVAEAPPSAVDTADLAAQIQSLHRTLRQAAWHAKRNNREAAPLFSDVASQLTTRAAGASPAVKEDLQVSASELTGLSERIYTGPPITPKELNVVQAGVHWALAAFHQEQAAASWPDGSAQEVAMHLSSSAGFISAAIGYAGGPVKEPGRKLAERTKALAQRVADETAPASDDVSGQLQAIGRTIRQLSNRVKKLFS